MMPSRVGQHGRTDPLGRPLRNEGPDLGTSVKVPDEIDIQRAREILEELYELTRAEADLVRLVSEGRSLEEVARTRGVTINTVRSQLKQVFSKTDTSRQGELVHLVLSGVASLGDTPDSD